MTRIWVEKISRDVYVLRIDDSRTRFFESLWSIPEGITYNAYLLTSPEHTVLFDGWKAWYSEDFLETISTIIEPRSIDYIVIHHMEPDHTGSLPRILGVSRDATVLGHPMSKAMLKEFYGLEPRFKPVRNGETFSLEGLTLRFIHTPWLHWPETMMTLLEEEGILFTGDAFGGYSIPSSLFDDDESLVEWYMRYARKYLATVIGHYRQHVVKAVEKLSSMDVKPRILAPAHGLIWRRSPETIVSKYVSWAKAEPQPGKITVVYGSAYGSTETMVKLAVKILGKAGCSVVTYKYTDLEEGSLSDLLGDALDSAALVIGASTYEAGILPSIRRMVEELAWKTAAPKPLLVLSSYGWGGVAGKKIAEILGKAGFNVVEVVEARDMPSDEEAGRIMNAARRLAEACGGKA